MNYIAVAASTICLKDLHPGYKVHIVGIHWILDIGSAAVYRSVQGRHCDSRFESTNWNICSCVQKTKSHVRKLREHDNSNTYYKSQQELRHLNPLARPLNSC